MIILALLEGQILSTETILLLSKVLLLITQVENHKKRIRTGHTQEINSWVQLNNPKKEKKDLEKKHFRRVVSVLMLIYVVTIIDIMDTLGPIAKTS